MEAITITGATVNRIPLTSFPDIKVAFPDLNKQVAIADILSAYDDLIENNRRRIALLEEAARLLYREWFVHFRFPGHEHVKIIDGIPKGWKRQTLGELAEVVMGQSPKSQYYNAAGDGLPFHQGVTDYGFRFVSHRTYSTAVTKLAETGDILVSVRAPVGRINVTRDKIVLGRGLAAVRSRTKHQSFLFYALKNRFYAEDIIGTGAIYAATNKKEFEGQTLIEPSKIVLAKFEEQARDIDQNKMRDHKSYHDKALGFIQNERLALPFKMPKLAPFVESPQPPGLQPDWRTICLLAVMFHCGFEWPTDERPLGASSFDTVSQQSMECSKAWAPI